MKTRQKRQQILSFHEGSNEEYSAFITKNASVLRAFVLHFDSPLDKKLQALCVDLGLCYIVGALPEGRITKIEDLDSVSSESNSSESKAPNADTTVASTISPKIIHKVRSGEEIYTQSDIVILGDLANGAHISTSGNVTIFGDCEGAIEVGGEFLIMRNLKSGHIRFGTEMLQETIIAKLNANSHLKIIIKNSGKILVKELL